MTNHRVMPIRLKTLHITFRLQQLHNCYTDTKSQNGELTSTRCCLYSCFRKAPLKSIEVRAMEDSGAPRNLADEEADLSSDMFSVADLAAQLRETLVALSNENDELCQEIASLRGELNASSGQNSKLENHLRNLDVKYQAEEKDWEVELTRLDEKQKVEMDHVQAVADKLKETRSHCGNL